MTTMLLIDGQNFLNKLTKILIGNNVLGKNEKINWRNYNFLGLFNQIFQNTKIDKKFFYIAKLIEYLDTKDKSRELIERQRILKTHLERQGFNVIVAGRVRKHIKEIINGKEVSDFKEKGVDVKIAVDMITMSLLDKQADNIILASSDSDLQPAIKEIRKRSKNIILTYLGFEEGLNKGLTYTTNKTIVIRNSEVVSFYKSRV